MGDRNILAELIGMAYYTAVILRWQNYQEPVVEATATVQSKQKWIPEVVSTPVYIPTPIITESLDAWIAASNWPSQYRDIVKRIIMCESGGNPNIVSPTGYVGLMQVAPWYHGYPSSNPVEQLNQGYEIWKKQGFGAWECY